MNGISNQLAITTGDIRINLGSGIDYREGYFNIDANPAAKTDFCINFLQIDRIFLPDTVSETLMLHSLNYLNLWQARDLFAKIHRLLKRNGILIIETVNLEKAVEKIISSIGNFEQYLEGVRALHAFGVDQLQRKEIYTPNAFSWTPWHLTAELKNAGFGAVEVLPPQTHARWRDMRVEARKN
ncbi:MULTISPECIES: hypothetical protein [Geobacter]|uniref:hypothetical protein n=1 Tax=Geobacter TaxID=28231 RepID=UPI002573FE49|nr:hypothetical protein [Geobacter sulfurreducens]BEH11549.1 hypothetical protein GSUET_31610 [Geobacter sulfurreducens subsp. ethanolicus]BET59405.1 hypothetical protein GEO60473_24450 [Geobacter sp. 60473]